MLGVFCFSVVLVFLNVWWFLVASPGNFPVQLSVASLWKQSPLARSDLSNCGEASRDVWTARGASSQSSDLGALCCLCCLLLGKRDNERAGCRGNPDCMTELLYPKWPHCWLTHVPHSLYSQPFRLELSQNTPSCSVHGCPHLRLWFQLYFPLLSAVNLSGIP